MCSSDLKKALEQVRGQYDFCVIDNAPDINISTINALVASNDVIVPLEVDDNTTEGLAELAEQIEFTREDLNPELTFRGCFITKYDKRNEAHAQGAAQLEAAGKYPVFRTKIRTSRKVSESTFARLPITVYSKRSNAAIDYAALAETSMYSDRHFPTRLPKSTPAQEPPPLKHLSASSCEFLFLSYRSLPSVGTPSFQQASVVPSLSACFLTTAFLKTDRPFRSAPAPPEKVSDTPAYILRPSSFFPAHNTLPQAPLQPLPAAGSYVPAQRYTAL